MVDLVKKLITYLPFVRACLSSLRFQGPKTLFPTIFLFSWVELSFGVQPLRNHQLYACVFLLLVSSEAAQHRLISKQRIVTIIIIFAKTAFLLTSIWTCTAVSCMSEKVLFKSHKCLCLPLKTSLWHVVRFQYTNIFVLNIIYRGVNVEDVQFIRFSFSNIQIYHLIN